MKIKSTKNFRLNVPMLIVAASILSSSCGALGGMCKLALSDSMGLSELPAGQSLGVVLTSSSPGLPQVRGDALYGIWPTK